MLRFLLLFVLLTFIYRAASRLWSGIVRGLQDEGRPASGARTGSRTPSRSVQMARDPICGTFVVPERAVALSGINGERHHFCSTACRDQFVASQATPVTAAGRTA